MVKISCAFCGSEKRIRSSLYNRNKTGLFFCNNKCRGEWRRYNTVEQGKRGCTCDELEKIKLLAELNKKLKEGGNKNEIRKEYNRQFGQL